MDDNKFYSAHKLFGRDGGCALGLRMIVGHLDSRGLSWVTTCIIVYILLFMLGSSLALLYLLFFTLAVLLFFFLLRMQFNEWKKVSDAKFRNFTILTAKRGQL